MRFGRSFIVIALILVIGLTAALPALAARTAFRYDTAQRVIDACVLSLDTDGDGTPEVPNPYFVEGLRRSDLTPDDWTFRNPLAPATMRTDRANPVVKGNMDYWVVELTPEGVSRLVGMDLIYLASTDLDFDTTTTEGQIYDGLQAAVEAGALLWIDNTINPVTTIGTFPWDIEFDSQTTDDHVLEAADTGHALLREPHALGRASISRLGDRPDSDEYESGAAVTRHFLVSDALGAEFRTVIESAVYDDPTGAELDRDPWAVAADYGSGSVLVTSGYVGGDVVEWILQRQTGGTDWRPSPNVLQAPDVKLGLNAVQWNDRWQQARRTPRASASTVARAPFPLEVAWQYPGSDDDTADEMIGPVVSSPVHARNVVYAVSNPTPSGAGHQPYLMAFDMTPEEDRDGNQDSDDGQVTDYALGTAYDMIWGVALNTDHNSSAIITPRYASATVTSYTDPGSNLANTADDVHYPQVVLVSYVDVDSGVGYVDCYNATTANLSATDRRLWRRAIQPYETAGGNAEVLAVSTPVVHKGYVYVLASEYDSALGANDPNSTYGRAHCFELDYPWNDDTDAPDLSDGPWPEQGSWWVYPSDKDDLDLDGNTAAPEPQQSLPPFHDPNWLAEAGDYSPPPAGVGRTALPPAPGAFPVVHASGGAADGTGVDALLTFGTAVSFAWDGSSISIDASAGGSQYTLVPTPFRLDNNEPAKPGYGSSDLPFGVGLNHNYFIVRLAQTITSFTNAESRIDGTLMNDVLYEPVDPPPNIPTEYLWFSSAVVREAIANAPAAGMDPLDAQQGLGILVDYNALPDMETRAVPGPVRWRRVLPVGETIRQPAAMHTNELAVTSGEPINYEYVTSPPAPVGSGVSKLDPAAGTTKWSYDPVTTTPGVDPTTAHMGASTTAAAFDDETMIVGSTAVDYNVPETLSAVMGLQRQVDIRISDDGLIGANPAAVILIESGDIIAPGNYQVDQATGQLRFPATEAGSVVSTTGADLGPIYGQAIQVEDIAGNLRDHYVPDIERFRVTPGHIRLHYRPIEDGTVTITRADGTAVTGWAWADTSTRTFGQPDPRTARLDGWIDLTGATDADGADVEPGDDLLVSYVGWNEGDGWITIPNTSGNIPSERHQMPAEFGPSLSSPVVAGDTIHLSTQGIDSDLNDAWDLTPPDALRTLLSLRWNRATGFVASGTAAPAERQSGVGGVPVVSGSPAIADDNVFVGSRLLDSPTDTALNEGYVSALKPWRVLLCDSNRIVETTGADPSWVCTGTSSPQRAQSFVGEDLQRAFSRPAKASYLETGNILVVDSGNHRVVEIDRAGRIVWPLDLFGYEYYTSPDNDNLRLSRPADAHRYWDVDDDGFPVMHTVIADTGNARVIDIETTFYNPNTMVQDGRQRHSVEIKTPTYVRTADRGAQRVRYTSSVPITDPFNEVVIGYLCAASNMNQLFVVTAEDDRLVNPYASNPVDHANATTNSTWAYWAWLYDSDPTDGDDVSNEPLQFENIKHVDVQRIGGTIHVAVTCTRYLGRSGGPNHALADAGSGVFEFRIDVSEGAGSPDLWELDRMGTGSAWPTADPHWYFAEGNYKFHKDTSDYSNLNMSDPREITRITTDADDYYKRWYPVCSKRLSADTVLITNSLSQIESATPGNIGAGVRDAVLGSHIFEVVTSARAVDDPTDDTYTIDPDRSVPAPGEIWADPFTQPSYAEVR